MVGQTNLLRAYDKGKITEIPGSKTQGLNDAMQHIFFPKICRRIFPDHFLAKRLCRPGARKTQERKGENPARKTIEEERNTV